MCMTNTILLCRKCYINHFMFQTMLKFSCLKFLLSLFKFCFNGFTCFVYPLSDFWTILRSNIFHSF